MSRYDDLWEESSDFIYIPICPDNGPYEGGIMQRFTQSFLGDLERELGRGLVASGGDDYRIHQNVVAMVAAEECGLATVEFRNMKWVSDMVAIHGFAGHVADISAVKVVIFAPWESGLISDDIIQNFYLQMQEATAFHTNVRVYPNREEKDAAGLKLTDIATLLRIAKDPATPTAFSHQPKTCLGRGECTMANWSTKMVLKRNFSCGSRDVRVVDGSSESCWSLLACTGHKLKSDMTTKGNQKRSNGKNNNKKEGRKKKHNKEQKNRKEEDKKEKDETCTWFHQEFIKKLKEWGEIRVFIIRGRIIFRAYTRPVQGKEDSLYVRPLKESDFLRYSNDEEKRKDKWKELDEYCLYIYHALMKSSKQSFESAQVGLRLDVGMTDKCCFFGLEPTRWYAADWFSGQLCGRDLTDIAQQYGKAFAEWLHRDC
ncbi:uncharacterized protein FFNC_15642 [Fusarium fujikuroi]|nr:uncharacterized protein FFNC_15642 [Fusarium fujikuroi]